MAGTLVSADWQQLYDRYYRKREVYQLDWNVDLGMSRAVAAPYGGPIAVTRDDRKIIMLEGSSLKQTIDIYSCAGTMISSFVWPAGQKLIEFGWNNKEQLVCVMDDGTVQVFTIHGELIKQFTMGEVCMEGVEMACVWESGMVCITSDTHRLFVVEDFAAPEPTELANPNLAAPPTAVAVIPPAFTISGGPEVLLGTESGSIVVVDADRAEDMLLSNGPFTHLEVAPTGKIVACFTEDGLLWVITADFQKNLSEFNTQSKKAPRQIAWCGPHSVVLYWDRILLMVGPYGDWVKYNFDDPLVLVSECDGVRIVSNDTCEFLSRVMQCTEDVFKVGSVAPASILYDAFMHFQAHSPRSDENIRSIRSELSAAVDQCIDAAAEEMDPNLQRQLLKSAAYGKTFCEFYNADVFVNMARTLRVLNAVRNFEIGMPLTHKQFERLSAPVLIDRLINRHHHLLALRICEFLKMRPDRVLIHWACAKVRRGDDYSDEELCKEVCTKFALSPNIPYVGVAKAAYRAGRPRLATLLLDREPNAGEQVPLLMSMQEDALALEKAIESGDTDLIYLVMMRIKRDQPYEVLFQLLGQHPVARALFEKYGREQDRELLKDFYYHLGKQQRAADISVLEGYENASLKQRTRNLEVALQLYRQSNKDSFMAKATEDQLKLLMVQVQLEASKVGGRWVDLSVSQTITELVRLGQHKRAQKMHKDFKVPDRRFWTLKLHALADARDWTGMERFAKEKKPPIGFKPFVDACIEKGVPDEAAKYIPRIGDKVEMAEYYVRIGYFREAADIAMALKNVGMLNDIAQKVGNNRSVLMYIEQHMQQLQGKR